jgi:putative aldouronate transport system permease protein
MLLKALGFEPIFFMMKIKYFRPIYAISGIWQHMGWSAIIYLASISTIDPQIYEASIVDGAGKWKQFLHITLPSISTTIITMLVLNIGLLMNTNFEKIFLMSNPTVRQVSEVITTYVYRRGILTGDYSFATAVGLFNSVVTLVLIMITNKISKKVSDISLW